MGEALVKPPSEEYAVQMNIWVMRGKQKGTAALWRPARTVQRCSTKRELIHLDNQNKQYSSLPGLNYVQRDFELAIWQDWWLYPHLHGAHDLGSECLCKSHALEFFFKMNYTRSADIDHGCMRTTIETRKATDMHEFFSCLRYQLHVAQWSRQE